MGQSIIDIEVELHTVSGNEQMCIPPYNIYSKLHVSNMGNVSILDCTLRDGGYINDWRFGKEAIDYILRKLVYSGIELIEIGFIKNTDFDENRTVYPNVELMNQAIPNIPHDGTKFIGMVDMSNPVPMDSIPYRDRNGIDGIRVIFKQDRIDLGFEYAKDISKKGYLTMIQLVSTDTYSDSELVDVIKKFNSISPYAVYIVDSLGVLKKKDFMRMVYIMDHNLDGNISLGYHSHNNLQQARGNAESFVELGLKRNIIADACVFGMGRGAGNLNEELFADYLNENYGKQYRIEPMLEIIDEYLNEIYRNNFWGYSLPFYLSAKNKVHPNYAKFYHEKGTLTEKAFNELLKTISIEDSHVFNKELANKYYIQFMKNYVDDRQSLKELSNILRNETILLLAPGENLILQKSKVDSFIKANNPLIISIGFIPQYYTCKYTFCSNLRKYDRVKNTAVNIIATSNIKNITQDTHLVFNYTSYLSNYECIVDNGGIILLKILRAADIHEIYVAGMDGYAHIPLDVTQETYISSKITINQINESMSSEISELKKDISITFITDSKYN